MMVVRILAHQLASSDTRIGAAIRAVVEKNSNILMLPLRLQFRKLISDPLSTIEVRPRLAVIVIDALDERGTAATRKSLLTKVNKLSSHFRTIVTSRANIDIFNAFESQHHIFTYELDITPAANSDDILAYFRCLNREFPNQNHFIRPASMIAEPNLWGVCPRTLPRCHVSIALGLVHQPT